MFQWLRSLLREIFHVRSASYALPLEYEDYVADQMRSFFRDPELIEFLLHRCERQTQWASVCVHSIKPEVTDDKYLYLHWDPLLGEVNWYDFEVGASKRRSRRQQQIEQDIEGVQGMSRYVPKGVTKDYEYLNRILVTDFLDNLRSQFGDHPTLLVLQERHAPSAGEDENDSIGSREVITHSTH